VSETELPKVKLGQPADITFEALPGVTLKGVVDSIAPTATSGQSVVTYLVQVRFDPDTAGVQVGMSADLNIEVERHTGVLQAPSRAITTVGPIKTVQVLYGQEQTPVTIQVETGASNGTMTEIVKCIDTGAQCLRANDRLAISLPSGDTSGGPVDGSGNTQFFAAPAGAAPGGKIERVVIDGP
jgi:macrolide-specific efflux system membrane fusion protein